MTGNVKFSIVTPVYKVEAYLDDCVRSVLAQSYENFELLLVDDGSPDRCGEMCDAWEKRDGRIRAFHKPNGGADLARCHALERMRGDYAVFLDSDDLLRPNALEVLYRSITSFDCDCVFYGFDARLGEDIVPGFGCDERICGRLLRNRREVCSLILPDDHYNAIWRKCARASCFDLRDYSACGTIRYGEDVVRSLEILENAESFLFIPDRLYLYRANPEGAMSSVDAGTLSIDHRVDELVDAMLAKTGVFGEEEYDRLRNARLDSLAIGLRALARSCPDRQRSVEQMARLRDDGRTAEIAEIGYRKVPVLPGQEQGIFNRLLFRVNISLFRHRRYGLFIMIDRFVCRLKG